MSLTTRTGLLFGESGSCVVRVTREDGEIWVEKSGPPAEIAQEAAVLRWCKNLLPVARILDQQPGVLKMGNLPGRPASDSPPEIACAVLAEALRLIHALPTVGCPFMAEWSVRLHESEVRLEAGLIDESDFDDENRGRSADSILAELRSFPPLPARHCFTHGDATLENFLAHDGKLSGIADMGRSGIAHPAQDWALALRSVRHHFGPKGERLLRRHMPHDCREVSLLRRFCLLDELF